MVGSERLSNRLLNIYLPLVFYLVFLLFPFYWMTIVSFKPTNDLFDLKFNPFWIQRFILENYTYLFQRDRVLRVGEEHPHRVGGVHGPVAFLQRLCRLRAGSPALPGEQLPGRGDLHGVPGAPDAPVPAAGAGHRRARPLQHLLGAHPHVSHAAHPVRLLAPHGILPHHSQGDRGERHGRRLLATPDPVADGPPALRSPASCRRAFSASPCAGTSSSTP